MQEHQKNKYIIEKNIYIKGCTKKLYFHLLKDNLGYLIDAPGYGYNTLSV